MFMSNSCMHLLHVGGQPMDPKIAAMLAAAGRTAESFPPDFANALLAGRVGT